MNRTRMLAAALMALASLAHATTPSIGGRYVPGSVSLEDQARKYPSLYTGIAPDDGR